MVDTTRGASVRFLPVLRALALVGAVCSIGTTFLPWASSGDRTRSSYAIVDVAERAGVLSASTADLSSLWFLLPILGGAALLSAALGFDRVVALTTGTIGVAVVAGAVLVARSPLVVESGVVLGIGVGTCTAAMGIGTLIMTTRRNT